MDVTEETVKNTFVFTEQDLPGFKSKSNTKFDTASANMPARLNRSRIEKQKGTWDPNKKFQPFFKKAIPSETSSQAIHTETDALNRENHPCWQNCP